MYKYLPIFFILYITQCYSAQIHVSPSLITTRESINVSWANITKVNVGDYIEAYIEHFPKGIAKILANTSETFKLGYGSVVFSLLNMRQRYYFRYYTGSTMLAQSEYVDVVADYPMQGHIAITNNPAQMIVKWVSNNTQTPTVQYGLNGTNLSWNVTGTSTTYGLEDLCDPSSTTSGSYFIPPGMIHHVLLDQLQPSTVYYYRFGAGNVWSDVMSFKSRNIDLSAGFKAIMFGDLGVGNTDRMPGFHCSPATDTMNLVQNDIETNNYDVILHVGDISYAEGFSWRWDQFFEQIQPVATQVPYMVGIGNHEYDHVNQPFNPDWMNYAPDSGGECGVPFLKRFSMPNNNLWYSLDYPLVHIVVMSSEHDFTSGSPQYQWIENDLQQVNHSQKWIIFTGHRPLYSSTVWSTEQHNNEEMREHLEPLLLKYEVDLALWAHMHNYERTCPLQNHQCLGDYSTPGGPVHMVVGSGGAWAFRGRIEYHWSKFWKLVFGYIRIDIPDRNSMNIEFQQTNGNMDVIDKITLKFINDTYEDTLQYQSHSIWDSEQSLPLIIVGTTLGGILLIAILVVLIRRRRMWVTEVELPEMKSDQL